MAPANSKPGLLQSCSDREGIVMSESLPCLIVLNVPNGGAMGREYRNYSGIMLMYVHLDLFVSSNSSRLFN